MLVVDFSRPFITRVITMRRLDTRHRREEDAINE
jgi:hypothetical protein